MRIAEILRHSMSGREDSTSSGNCFTASPITILRDRVAHLLRRGLDQGYLPHEAEGRRLRGKLLLDPTLKRCVLRQGRVVCQFDELSPDVPHNRVVKAAMRTLDRPARFR